MDGFALVFANDELETGIVEMASICELFISGISDVGECENW